MPGQARSVEGRTLGRATQSEQGERAPLLAATPYSSKHDKAGLHVSGSLSFLGKAWVWCCCGALPVLLLTGFLALLCHHWHARATGSLSHPLLPAAASWLPPPPVQWRHASSHTAVTEKPTPVAVVRHEEAASPVRAELRKPKSAAARQEEAAAAVRHEEAASNARSELRKPKPAVVRHEEADSHARPELQKPQPATVPSRTPLLRARVDHAAAQAAAQPLVLTTRCSFPLALNYFCAGIIKTALQAEEVRISAEINKHLPKWVQGVALTYDGSSLIAEPTVRLTSTRDRSLFGFDPQMRLRCTFESLMRSPKVLSAVSLLSKYSGGLCSGTVGAAQCMSAGSSDASNCDPLGDALIADP